MEREECLLCLEECLIDACKLDCGHQYHKKCFDMLISHQNTMKSECVKFNCSKCRRPYFISSDSKEILSDEIVKVNPSNLFYLAHSYVVKAISLFVGFMEKVHYNCYISIIYKIIRYFELDWSFPEKVYNELAPLEIYSLKFTLFVWAGVLSILGIVSLAFAVPQITVNILNTVFNCQIGWIIVYSLLTVGNVGLIFYNGRIIHENPESTAEIISYVLYSVTDLLVSLIIVISPSNDVKLLINHVIGEYKYLYNIFTFTNFTYCIVYCIIMNEFNYSNYLRLLSWELNYKELLTIAIHEIICITLYIISYLMADRFVKIKNKNIIKKPIEELDNIL